LKFDLTDAAKYLIEIWAQRLGKGR
jgi:hypothetical protein